MSDEPQNAGQIEWLTYRFQQLEEEELFWLRNDSVPSNTSFRKLDDYTALNLVEQKVYSIIPTQMVYQKEY